MDLLKIIAPLCVIFCFAGFFLAYLYGKKTKNFKWSEYLLIIIWPTLCVLYMAYLYGLGIIVLYLASCWVGFVLEYLLGLIYHKVLNKKLWTYNRYSVNGYTSFLSIPFWGVGGVVFYFLAKLLGL